jgi:hypothetical protein
MRPVEELRITSPADVPDKTAAFIMSLIVVVHVGGVGKPLTIEWMELPAPVALSIQPAP